MKRSTANGGDASPAPFEEAVHLARPAALPAGERDVRVESAAFGLKPDRLARALDLGGEGGKRRLRLDAGPQGAGIALLEAADAGDAQCESFGADAGERGGKVFADGAFDLTDEPQGEVKLIIVLPAEVGAVVHCVDQQVADGLRRPNGDEQAVHGR